MNAFDASLHMADADPQGEDAVALLHEAVAEMRVLYPEQWPPGVLTPTPTPTPPGGVYLLAWKTDRAVGSGALRPLGGAVAEVRRIFVTRAARRTGVATALLDALEARGRALGYTALKLETGERQAPALALYAAQGWRQVPPFGEHVGDPTSVCFEKAIVAPGAPPSA